MQSVRHAEVILDLLGNSTGQQSRENIFAFVDLVKGISPRDNTTVKVKGKIFMVMANKAVSRNNKADV